MYATAEDLQAYMQTTFTAEQLALANTILSAVSEYIDVYTWNKFEPTQVTDEMYTGKGGNILVLRHYPIISLDSIKYVVSGGQEFPLDVSPMIVNKETGVIKCYTPTYISVFGYYRDPFPNGMPIIVSYSYGYGTVPNPVHLACLMMANKIMVAPKDESMYMQQETIGKYQYRTNSRWSNELLITAEIAAMLAPYIKRQVY